jgi:hypothetical protein
MPLLKFPDGLEVGGDAGKLELLRAGRANRISVSGDRRGDAVDSSLSKRRRRIGRRSRKSGVTASHRLNPYERLDNVAAAELRFADGQHPIQRAQHSRRRGAEG